MGPVKTAKKDVAQGHRRIEMCTGNRAEGQDEGNQSGTRGQRVDKQCDCHIAPCQSLAHDARANDDRQEKRCPQELSDQSARQRHASASPAASRAPASAGFSHSATHGMAKVIIGAPICCSGCRAELPVSTGVLIANGFTARPSLLPRQGRHERPRAARANACAEGTAGRNVSATALQAPGIAAWRTLICRGRWHRACGRRGPVHRPGASHPCCLLADPVGLQSICHHFRLQRHETLEPVLARCT